MTKKGGFTLLLLFVAAGMFLLIFRKGAVRQLPEATSVSTVETRSNAPVPPVAAQKTAPAQTTTEIITNNRITAPSGSDSDYTQQYAERRNADHKFDWKQPINFYGKVVDQNGDPIAGAVIDFEWSILWDPSIPQGVSNFQTMSDASGWFSLRDKKGKGMTVSVSREGYYATSSARQSFEYANPYEESFYRPDSDKPVVFQLRKKGATEPMFHFGWSSRIPKDGAPVAVDLKTGEKGSIGDYAVIVECWTKDDEKDQFNHYDWKCKISVPTGGLIESTNEYPFEAPREGYQPSDEMSMSAAIGRNVWRSRGARNYFIKFNDGNYAYVKFEMVAAGDHFFQLGSFFNPSSSRNLEYDPIKDLMRRY